MIKFLLTNWWIYIPIILVLLFLTAGSNQKLKAMQRNRELAAMSPEQRQRELENYKRKPGKFERITTKLGLRGILDHIFSK